MTRRVVTVHASSWEPDARYDCDTWLTAHAVCWWFGRKRGRRVTVRRDAAPRLSSPAWWVRVWRTFTDDTTRRPGGGVP